MLKFKLNFIVISLLILSLCNCIYSKQEENGYQCNQLDTCQCTFFNGYGINLNGINLSSDVKNDTKIVFHPCSDITVNISAPDNECSKGTSLCLITLQVINLGTSTDFKFESGSNSSDIRFVSKNEQWTTTITLQCVRDANELEVTKIDYEWHVAELILKSPKSCKTDQLELKLSYWSIAFVMLCTSIFIYLIGGALVMKFLYDAQGVEMIPHRTFWSGVGTSIMNFLKYCTNGCVNSGGYDRI